MFCSRVSTIGRWICPHQVNEKHQCIWSVPNPRIVCEDHPHGQRATESNAFLRCRFKFQDPREPVSNALNTDFEELYRGLHDMLLHFLKILMLETKCPEASGQDIAVEKSAVSQITCWLFRTNVWTATCVSRFLCYFHQRLLLPSRHQEQRVRKQRSCVWSSQQWDERKPFLIHLSWTLIPNSALQRLQTAVTQEHTDESLQGRAV